MLFPDRCFSSVASIPIEEFKKNNIKGIAIDVDNTLIDYQRHMSDSSKKWVEEVKQAGYQICILSNSNKVDKIEKVAETLKIEYIMSARKPLKRGFKQVARRMQLPYENIAVIGDQVFTDVLGANRMNMFSIYVEPISKKEYWYTKWKRPIEAFILKLRPKNN